MVGWYPWFETQCRIEVLVWVVQVLTGWMLFLSPSWQCQSTEGKSEHSVQPGKLTIWPEPFLIHCRTSEEWGVAPFAPAVRHQYPIFVVSSCLESLSYLCERFLIVLRWLDCCIWRWMYFIANPFTVATWLLKLADALLYCMDSSWPLVCSHTIAAVYHSVVLYVRYCSDVVFWHNSCSNVVHSECI